jgi:protein-S-isoprenylcysteine O-methyltransferase Ste14
MRIRIGAFLFRYRNVVGPIVFLLVLLIGQPRYPLGRSELDPVFDGLGAACALQGEALRIITIGYEYIERGGKNRQVYASKLVTGGVFGQCRNPLYVGNILLVVGVALILHSYAFYLVLIPFVLFSYSCIVAAEETFLKARFGTEYEQYCRRVNRWWPRLSGWKESTDGMQFNWRRVLVKEYNTIFLLFLSLVGVKLWCDYRLAGPGALPPPEYLATGLGAWLVLYIIVRSLKKTGYVKA